MDSRKVRIDEQQIFQSLRPKNNICISERDLSRFDRESVVSRCRNRKFKAKHIRNNMVLYKSKQIDIKIGVLSKKISMILSECETKWTVNQNVKESS